jgi:tetratricopeptide (TPR) repeat protein
MPWWGVAMSQGPDINMDLDGDVDMKGSCAAVETALKLPNAPENERAWIEAIATRCPEYRPREHIDAMRRLAARYPDDPDVLTFYAESLMVPVRWRWYSRDGRPADGVAEAEGLLENVLRRYPEHPGANHFYIHAVESSSRPERAIPSAQRLMGIVPSAGHLVHMPGHIWFILGDYETAAAVNERAAELDRRYMKDSGVTSSAYFGYYVHNLHFISISRSMQGRMREAIDAADQIAEAIKPLLDSMPEMGDIFNATPLLIRVRFQRWDDVLAATRPRAQLALSASVDHYARALALQGKGRHAEALREQSSFEAGRARLPGTAPWLNNRAGDVLAVASEVLAARLADSAAVSVPHWQRAVALQDALVYDEPPGWYYPVRESLGAALLRAGKPADAEIVFREGLRRSPRNGRMLFGLLESLKAQQKAQAAEWVSREFETAWQRAEVPVHIDEL